MSKIYWDTGCLLVGCPSNIYRFFKHWYKSLKNVDENRYRSYREIFCDRFLVNPDIEEFKKYNIYLFDNFGGDGYAILSENSRGFSLNFMDTYAKNDLIYDGITYKNSVLVLDASMLPELVLGCDDILYKKSSKREFLNRISKPKKHIFFMTNKLIYLNPHNGNLSVYRQLTRDNLDGKIHFIIK
jgi:hypothetical protein